MSFEDAGLLLLVLAGTYLAMMVVETLAHLVPWQVRFAVTLIAAVAQGSVIVMWLLDFTIVRRYDLLVVPASMAAVFGIITGILLHSYLVKRPVPST